MDQLLSVFWPARFGQKTSIPVPAMTSDRIIKSASDKTLIQANTGEIYRSADVSHCGVLVRDTEIEVTCFFRDPKMTSDGARAHSFTATNAGWKTKEDGESFVRQILD